MAESELAQLHPKLRRSEIDPEKNLGTLLIEFLELYGRNFHYDEVGISIRRGGFYYNKVSRGWKRAAQPYLLSIEDPQDRGERVLNVQTLFLFRVKITTFPSDHSGSGKSKGRWQEHTNYYKGSCSKGQPRSRRRRPYDSPGMWMQRRAVYFPGSWVLQKRSVWSISPMTCPPVSIWCLPTSIKHPPLLFLVPPSVVQQGGEMRGHGQGRVENAGRIAMLMWCADSEAAS